MIGKLIPLLLALMGLGTGIGAGLALKPPPSQEAEAGEAVAEDCLPAGQTGQLPLPPAEGHGAHGEATGDAEYVKLNNQFVVPVVVDGRVSSLVVLSVTLEVAPGQTELVYAREPKIRDAMLQVLFDHANTGGFSGSFTASPRMAVLRRSLREVTQKILGPVLRDVLITDIVRQDA
ncbi:MAG: flagellar basal body-associated protein FliL [Alphaproteobacteria bacterium]|nr:MAG: flagellar basal body-associated protein FliL [Alphaproteobacteria bacterium]